MPAARLLLYDAAMATWVQHHADRIARSAARELEALVAVSSPSGDLAAAEECLSVVQALLPPEAEVARLPCSSPGHAPDLLASVRGSGTARILLLGHVDTVIEHGGHHPLVRQGPRLVGSGAMDMKGGDVLALGVLRAITEDRLADVAEVALLLVTDEEWRTAPFAHTARFAGWDACLCFEAGELDDRGRDAVVVRRKAAGTLRVRATGRAAHSGSRPDDGRNALLAVAEAARIVASHHDPDGPVRLTAVPTVLTSGDALNVVPAHGELLCDVRADTLDAFAEVMAAIPAEIGGAAITVENLRAWPGMDAREPAGPVLARAGTLLGREVVAASRGGASDASHLATVVPLTIDGLGPLGGKAHAPGEYVLEASLRSRAEVALAVFDAALTGG